MEREKQKAVLEALLFAYSEPINAPELSKATGFSLKETRELLSELRADYAFYHRGMILLQMEDDYQLATNPVYVTYLEKLITPRSYKTLSQASLEALAIVAYKQPITKAEIEDIRGVKCDQAIRTLLEKHLIEDKGRLEKIGRPIIYGTTSHFLKTFGFTSLSELPDTSAFFQSDEQGASGEEPQESID
ncbi:SMC-Scp complex subunit ScpB [Anoxynatronum sibiricum]|uniref:Segregation and condensation protein B n=1 Tax=Anoxynatronum sibiricum TaxID=210623 RepID=A0ABU9VR49_9CLOT